MVIINRSKPHLSSKKGTAIKKKVAAPVLDPYGILLAPLSTEKSIRQIEYENKIVFVVSSNATKSDVKKAVQELFKVKVIKVNIQNSFTGQKRAYVRLSSAHLASDLSADLGLI